MIVTINAEQRAPLFRLSAAASPEPLEDAPPSTGVTVFDLTIDATGLIAEDKVLTGQPPFISHSREALKEWRFDPQSGTKQTHVSATFLYKAKTGLPDKPSAFNLPVPAEATGESPFPTTIVVPGYPIGAFGAGAVVLQVSVGPTGEVNHVEVVRWLASLTEAAVDAVRDWRFTPVEGTSAGVPFSRIAIVVIWFQRPEYT